MQIHGSCVSRNGAGVLIVGPSGAGKSDLTLRLLDRGFDLVADDRVEIEQGLARAPAPLAGLLEVRGIGLLRLPAASAVPLALVVELGGGAERLPGPRRHPELGVPCIALDPQAPSAPQRVALALDCVLGRVASIAGAFAP
ncbi:MAG: hypothetical protein J2P47_08705 [Acetobacteraceae bacterium]|nr:hypothetical protein [Acetobacteraceae bacterium]